MQTEGALALNRKEVEIDAVIEGIAFIPAMLVDGRQHFLEVLLVMGCNFVQAKAPATIDHGCQLFGHERIEVYGSGAARRAIIGARVVVHPDREIVLPEIEPARMPVMVAIVVQEGLQKIEFGPQPFRVPTISLNKEGGMLSQARLAHGFVLQFLSAWT